MNRAIKKMSRAMMCALMTAVMIVIAAALMSADVHAAVNNNPLMITVKQTFSTSLASADGAFSYRLEPLEPGNPMPEGSAASGYTFTITGSGNVQIGPLSFTQPGVYRYKLSQVIGTQKAGYTYDRRVYTMVIHVGAELDVNVVVYGEDSKKEMDIAFLNKYHVLPSDPNLMVDPPVVKTVSGNPGKDIAFTFMLSAKDASYPMPAGSVDGTKTIRIVGSGKGEFGKWSYDKAGVYYYTVNEVNTGENGYTYDTAVYTITDTVKEVNGRFVMTRTVLNAMNKPVTSFTFINKYSSGGSNPGGGNPGGGNPGGGKPGGGDPGGGKPGENGPKTGDDRNTTFHITLFTFGTAMVISAMTFFFTDTKRRKAGRIV